jgi:putative transposase
MGHTYSKLLVHCVFATANREPYLTREVRERLWPFIGGIARANNAHALAVGGWADHAHMLLSLRPHVSVSKAMQEIKAGSSKFIHETFPALKLFKWQEGYGAFTIGVSGIDETIAYINGQEEHHRAKTYKEEFLAFLAKHNIEYDERYIWS